MRKFMGLTKRNLLIYFKDIQSVIFSMLTSIIVFVLYLLFLKSTFVDSIEGSMQGLEKFVRAGEVDMLANGILLAGILGSAMITVPYNCLSTIVRDRENKIDYDISATPIKRWQIIVSYFTASTLSAFVMTAVILTAGIGILSGQQKELYLTIKSIAALYGITLLGAVSATAFFMLVVLFFKTSSASGAFFGMLSAAAGFVIGAYIPISQFSEGVQTFCNLFPASGVTILFRNALLNGLLAHMNESIGGVDEGIFVESIKETFTFKEKVFGHVMSANGTVCYILCLAAICVLAMVILYPKIYKRK